MFVQYWLTPIQCYEPVRGKHCGYVVLEIKKNMVYHEERLYSTVNVFIWHYFIPFVEIRLSFMRWTHLRQDER